eukprot:1153050-Pelagomonas_calceolata.AAC.2
MLKQANDWPAEPCSCICTLPRKPELPCCLAIAPDTRASAERSTFTMPTLFFTVLSFLMASCGRDLRAHYDQCGNFWQREDNNFDALSVQAHSHGQRSHDVEASECCFSSVVLAITRLAALHPTHAPDAGAYTQRTVLHPASKVKRSLATQRWGLCKGGLSYRTRPTNKVRSCSLFEMRRGKGRQENC